MKEKVHYNPLLGGVLEPLYQLLDVKEKVYSAHKLALMLQELFGQEKLKLEDMQTVPLSQKIKKSIKERS